MFETKTLIWMRPLKYSGLVDLRGLYAIMDKWMAENHYNKNERRNHESVSEEGKQIILEELPWKKLSDYAKCEMRIYIEMTNLKEEVVTRNGLKHKYFHGDIFFSFDCYLVTDYEGHWESKPAYYFLRFIVDKFVYKSYTGRFEQEATSDCNEFINEIKAYLNMERFK
jgi:hypothetical protein